jgi:hypothetical protein
MKPSWDDPSCRAVGCGSRAVSQGFCDKHYRRWKKYGDPNHRENEQHGKHDTKEYVVWSNMIERCCNPNNNSYAYYGGRGIKICKEWRDSFSNFLRDMGERPKGTQIDRINTNGDYCKENCRWVPKKEQMRNLRSNIVILYRGESKCLKEWCELLNLSYNAIRKRLYRGWSIEKALSLEERPKNETFVE